MHTRLEHSIGSGRDLRGMGLLAPPADPYILHSSSLHPHPPPQPSFKVLMEGDRGGKDDPAHHLEDVRAGRPLPIPQKDP